MSSLFSLASAIRFSEFLAMTNGHNIPAIEHPGQALGWLDMLAQVMPPTVEIRFSSWLVIAAIIAFWIWRRSSQ